MSQKNKSAAFGYLIELRRRLLICVAVILAIFLCLFYFANDLYNSLALPMLAHLPEGGKMIATQIAAPLLVPLKLAFYLSTMLAVPVILYQLWAFVAPGLYRHERRIVWPLLLSSTLLFYVGVAFAYFIVLPLIFAFLMSVAPSNIAVMPDINAYLSFVFKLFFAFGTAFEVPVAVVICLYAGVTTVEALSSKRSYVILFAFIIGMLMTPPDVVSQIMLAIPIWLLFEVGLLVGRFVRKRGESSVKSLEDIG